MLANFIMLLLLLMFCCFSAAVAAYGTSTVLRFDIQWDKRTNASVPAWNETTFRAAAVAMAAQVRRALVVEKHS
jgi:hypothetical protein